MLTLLKLLAHNGDDINGNIDADDEEEEEWGG